MDGAVDLGVEKLIGRKEGQIGWLIFNNPERRNAYDPAMREQLGVFLDQLAYDDAIKVVLLRGQGGVFSTGADMNNAYSRYGEGTDSKSGSKGNGHKAARRPSQRRRLLTRVEDLMRLCRRHGLDMPMLDRTPGAPA